MLGLVGLVAFGVVLALAFRSHRVDARPACFGETLLPCVSQSVELALPIPGTPVDLMYSSERVRLAAESEGLAAWLERVGLAGWTPDLVHYLDLPSGVLHFGWGGSRSVDPIGVTRAEGGERLAVADGAEVHLFDRDGLHVETVLALDGTRVVSIDYGSEGILREVTAVGAGTATISHGDAEEITIESARGGLTRLSIDAGQLVGVSDVVDARHRIDVDSAGLVRGFEHPDGGSYRFEYDGDGRLLEARDPLGVSTTWERTGSDVKYSVVRTESSGTSTTWNVDHAGDGHTAELIRPDGVRVVEQAASGHHILTWSDGRRLDVRLAPDPRWEWQAPHVESATIAGGGGTPLTMSGAIEVTGGGDDPFAAESIRETWDVGGATETVEWDRDSRQLTTITPAGRVERVRLDDAGRVVSHAWGERRQEVTYGSHGEAMDVQWIGGGDPRLSFDYATDSVQIRGPEGISHLLTVDEAGRITGSRATQSGEVQIGRLASGAVSTVAADGVSEGQLTYMADGRLESFVLGGQTLRSWRYDAHGRPAGYADGGGRDVTLYYDAQSRPTQVVTAADTIDLRWNTSTGRIDALDGAEVQLAQGYQGSILVSESWAGAVDGSVERSLDDRLRVKEFAVGGTSLPMAYDADGLVTVVGAAQVDRDVGSGAIRRIEHANLVEDREYDPLGQLSSVSVQAGDRLVYRLALTRDLAGRVVERREQIGDSEARTSAMQYDRAGQLTEVTVNGTVTERYRYDAVGNRIRDQFATEVEYDDADRVVREGPVTFEYDDAGYLITRTDPDGTVRLNYDSLGLLREVRHEAGTTVAYEHDGWGRRVAAKSGGQPEVGLLYLDEQRPAATVGPGGIDSVFGYADGWLTPVTMIKGGDQYRIVADDTGSPRLVINAGTGEIAQRIDYNAFGQMIEDTAPGFQPFAFSGGILDPVSGLVRLGHRDYDPSAGRWTALDPILYDGGETNLYGYVGNDPVNWVDPSGLQGGVRSTVIGWGGEHSADHVGPGGRFQEEYPSLSGTKNYRRADYLSPTTIEEVKNTWRLSRRDRLQIRDQVAFANKSGRRAIVFVRGPDHPLGATRIPPEVQQMIDSGDLEKRHLRPFAGAHRRAVPFTPLPGAVHVWASEEAAALGEEISKLPVDLPDRGSSGDGSQGEDRFVCEGPPWTVVTAETSWICDERSGDWSSIHGEPHINTIDGVSFGFQAAGEFVYVDSPDLKVQARFEGSIGRATWATGIAVGTGDHVIEVIYAEAKEQSVGDAISVRIDGEQRLVDGSEILPGMRVATRRDGDAAKVYIGTDSGWLIAVENLNISQNIIVVPPEHPENTTGLLGSANGEPLDDLLRRDGSILPLDTLDTVEGLYGTYAAEWRVRTEERLFTDTPADTWTTDEITAVPDNVVLSLGDLPAEVVRDARQVCVDAGVPAGAELEDCTFDVAVTGEEGWARQQAASDSTRRFNDGDGAQRRGDDPLFIAAHRCQLDELTVLLEGGSDVAIRREKDGWTALLFASQHDCPQVVSALLAAGADPLTPNDKGFFPLYLAAQNGREVVARTLLDSGADPKQALPSGDTPLLIATFNQHPALVELLIDSGADPDIARDDGFTPILAAAQEGSPEILESLLAAGADINRSTFERLSTPLHVAASQDNLDVVSALLNAGADVDRQDNRGNTPLHYAAGNADAAIIRLLLGSGADPDLTNSNGRTPRDVADDSVQHLFR